MRPTPLALLLACAGLPLALLPALAGAELWPVWMAALGGFLLLLGADLVLAMPPAALDVDLLTPDQIQIGDRAHARLVLGRAGLADEHEPLALEVWPTLSERFERVQAARVTLTGARSEAHIPLIALRRGTGVVERVWLRWRGPLRLMARHRIVTFDRGVPVVPNLSPVRSLALRYFTPRESAVGLKVERYVGDGSEFESMREYVRGLDPRGMSWRQTARHRKLICQEFRAERNHAVVIAVDAGRLMSDPVEGVPKVDHAVTAGLVLAYAALRTGDRVGFYAFDAKPRQWMEPAAGAATFPRISHRASSVDYTEDETNHTLALAELGARLRRRTLIVLLTDFVDTITAELMIENVTHLARRHLVIFVALSDPAWRRLASQAPDQPAALHEAVVAAEFGSERERVLRRLQRLGVLCIDAPPARVSTDLLSQYLDLKRREVLG
ncbi:MAG: DUF58 domain-containing protein [Planctomycetota bacterium]|nr:DUF58 domain-containing protein [Planctomycetota bacterium]